jgi:hypothetical protein
VTELRDLRAQLDELAERRLLAREHVEAALAEIERAVVEALGGERLRLHSLHTQASAYRGVVLRGKFPDRRFDRDRHPSQILIRDDGRMVVAWIDVADEVEDRPLRAEDLDAEDLPLLVERVLYALKYHSGRVDAQSWRYAEISLLAQRVQDALARRT